MEELIKNEKVEYRVGATLKAHLKNVLLANIIYIVMWIAFDVFYIYITSNNSIGNGFWLVTITVGGLNLLLLWTFIFKTLKVGADLKNTGYILTDKALYYYCDGEKYKDLKRIAIEDIIAVEKSEYFVDGFYVVSEKSFIKVFNILNETEFFNILASRVTKAN